jgi:hypothetical protein
MLQLVFNKNCNDSNFWGEFFNMTYFGKYILNISLHYNIMQNLTRFKEIFDDFFQLTNENISKIFHLKHSPKMVGVAPIIPFSPIWYFQSLGIYIIFLECIFFSFGLKSLQ